MESVAGKAFLDLVREGISDSPRSRQVELGPSEIGDPCERKLAFKLLDTPKVGELPPWRQTVGTAVDEHLSKMLAQHPDWMVHGGRLHVGDTVMYPIKGTPDFYHIPSQSLCDLKTSGPSTVKKARAAANKGQISQGYRVQLHAYARGLIRDGYPVRKVVLIRMPSAGELDDTVIFEEDYDESIVTKALDRLNFLQMLVLAHGKKAPAMVEGTESYCNRCSYFRPMAKDLSVGCPGAGAQEFDKTLGGLLPG